VAPACDRLDAPKVREIKKALMEGEHRSVIAKRYGVSKRVISNIDREITWKNVPASGPSL
jgi:DNA invertase Pin-like site-specific DNA recombinase